MERHETQNHPEVLSAPEQALLRQVMEEESAASTDERIRVLTRAEFVDEVFYDSGHAVGGQIVGFNLSFDLSRLAIRHGSARRSMRGGFSLVLSEKKGRPAVAVKHLSQRAAMIRFTGQRPEESKAEIEEIDPDAPHVRAQYPEGDVATIGLNYLSAREPLWLTLADVLALKILRWVNFNARTTIYKLNGHGE